MQTKGAPVRCGRCSKNSRIEGAEYCSRCLVEVIEKRASRKLNPIKGSSGKPGRGRITIICESKTSLSCTVAAYLARKLCKTAAVSVAKTANWNIRMRQPASPHSAAILPECADGIAADFVEKMISRGEKDNGEQHQQLINVFESITEKELELYADIKKIKYTKAKGSGLKQKLQEFQAKHPGTIEALAKSSRQAEKIRLKKV